MRLTTEQAHKQRREIMDANRALTAKWTPEDWARWMAEGAKAVSPTGKALGR